MIKTETPIIVLGFAHVNKNEMQLAANNYKHRIRKNALAINNYYKEKKKTGHEAPCTRIGEYYAR